MKEVVLQGSQALEFTMDETRAAAHTKHLSSACRVDVATVVRNEVLRFESNLKQLPAPAPSVLPASPSQGELRALRAGFASRLRTVVAPMHRELDSVAEHLQQADATLRRCRVVVQQAEAMAAEAVSAAKACASRSPGGEVNDLAAERVDVQNCLAAGQYRQAFEQALIADVVHNMVARSEAQDASHESLVEFVCDALSGETGTEPEEVLQRPAVAADMDGRLRLVLTSQLLRCAVCSGTALARLESDLDWAFSLLEAVDRSDDGIAEVLETTGVGMASALEALQQGDSPAALAGASVAERRRVARTARLALKSLGMLSRLAR